MTGWITYSGNAPEEAVLNEDAAALERRGPGPHGSARLYRGVRLLDPDDIEADLGRDAA